MSDDLTPTADDLAIDPLAVLEMAWKVSTFNSQHIKFARTALPALARRLIAAESALAELWGLLCPDCGPNDYASLVAHVRAILEREDKPC